MRPLPLIARPLAAAVATAGMLTAITPMAPVGVASPVQVLASESTHTVDGAHDFQLPDGISHIAIHWPGESSATVEVAFSADGDTFGDPAEVELDDVGMSRNDGHTYGAITPAEGMRVARVSSDRPLVDVTVLALDAGGSTVEATTAAGAAPIPAVIPRSGWGADESLRFDENGEIWAPVFYPLQKFIIHHTATGSGGSNPAASIRAIYYYHAVTQGWGDIGYNYLIDASGRVYEGRRSRDYAAGISPTSDNGEGLVVEAGHSYHHNPGSMGIAFLGTFTSSPPTSSARSSLVRMLSWASVLHGVDPRRASTYVNPASGTTRWTQNIAGHRDYNPTACPGVITSLLAGIRQQVAGAIIDRYAGADRYGTAELISRSRFASGVPVAFVTTGENYPDALAGSVAAGLEGGPVLLVTRNSIPPATARELVRLHPAHIVVVGGPAAVSDAVINGLLPYAPGGVQRIAGADRYATAAAVSAATFAPGVSVAFVATGRNYPDALAGSVAAGLGGGPILMVEHRSIPPATAAELTRLQPSRIVVLGGTGVVSQAVAQGLAPFATGGVQRIAGADRYATAAAVSAATFAPGVPIAYVATGKNYPDALAGSVIAQLRGGPVLLVTGSGIPAATAAELARLHPGRVVVLGGWAAVGEGVRVALGAYPVWPSPPPPPPPPPSPSPSPP